MMPRNILNAYVLLMFLFLGGCAVLEPNSDLPTLMPAEYVPTAIALTAEALITPSSTPDLISTATTAPTQIVVPSATATTEIASVELGSPTPTALGGVILPGAEIQIIKPGPLSKIVRILEIIAYITPGGDGNAQVELWGEDGRLMYRRVFNFLTPNPQGRLVIEFGFETAGVAEAAQLVIQTRDIHGRMQALASQDLILLAEGESDLNVAGDLLAPVVIQQPQAMTMVRGEILTVSGLVRSSSDQPLLVELIAADGSVVGSRLAGLVPTDQGEHHSFSVDIPYQVSAPTWVRVTISERGGRFPRAISVTTSEVLLSP